MRINLTLLLQLLNIIVTIWMVRKILWPYVFKIFEQEKTIFEEAVHSSDELSRKIKETEQNQLNQEIAIAQLIQKTLRETYKKNSLTSETPRPMIAKKTMYPRSHHQASNTAAANKLILILQTKF